MPAYRATIPLRLYVEAEDRAAGIEALRALWLKVQDEGLPVGAGVFEKDHLAMAHLEATALEEG